jgi:hypothetical protein
VRQTPSPGLIIQAADGRAPDGAVGAADAAPVQRTAAKAATVDVTFINEDSSLTRGRDPSAGIAARRWRGWSRPAQCRMVKITDP